jgi:hypothetical protein
MLAYRLDKQISAEKIIQDIQKLISSRNKEIDSLVLVISLKNIIDTNPIPKIEYKDCST